MALKELSEARGTSGREEGVRRLVLSLLPEAARRTAEIDPLGNLHCMLGEGRPGPRVLLLAHMDEVGLMVTGHTEEGLLRIRPSGGVDPRVLPGKPVLVGDSAIPGVISIAPNHLTSHEERRALRFDELRLDIGAECLDTARDAAPVGAMVTFDTPYIAHEEQRIATGKALDDRVGVHLALRALAGNWGFPLHVAFTVQEEVGLRGAQVAARRVQPDLALVLEATAAGDTPGNPPGLELTTLRRGPALTVVDSRTVPDPGIVRGLIAAAEAAHAPWQWRRGRGGGNDAGAVWPEGIPSAALSVPCRYLHTPISLLSLDDLGAAEAMLLGWLRGLGEVV